MNNSKTSNNGTRIYVVFFPLKEESEEVPKKFGNGICRAVLALTKTFFIQNSRFLFSRNICYSLSG